MTIPDNNKYKNNFRRVSHPRKDLQLTEDGINYLISKGRSVPNVNASAVYKELSNYYDPYDTGLDLGNKQIRHSEKRSVYNKIYFNWDKKPVITGKDSYEAYFLRKCWREEGMYKGAKIDKTKFNVDKVYEHITKQKLIYGTMNPFSPIRPLGTDVDNSTDNPELVLPFLYLFQSYYPRSFHDSGSSGKSLHYYPKIDMVLLYEYYCQNTDITCEWAEYANTIIQHTSRIFKIYGHILCPEHTLVTKTLKSGKTKFVPKYHVEFDAFKASYPEYEFYRDDDGTPHPTQMTKNGVLHKIPNIFTVEDLVTFIDSPVYSIIHHLTVSVYLCNLIILSGCYSDADYKKLTSALKEIEPILIAHSVLLPSQAQAKNIVTSSSTIPPKKGGEEREERELCIYNGTFEDLDDICHESDAFMRSRRYLYYCFTKYMMEEGREPTINEYIQDYRQDAGTGPEDPEDRKRLEYIYHKYLSKMRKYIYGSLSQKIDMMENKLIITQDEIDNMSTYDRKLRKRDVAITAVWISTSLTNVEHIKWNDVMYGHMVQHYNRELAVPMSSLGNFIEYLKGKELTKYGCNPRKARALRELVISMDWFQCVDDSVVIGAYTENHKGRARRYILLPDHPDYMKFEGIIGADRIEYWKEFRKEQLRLRALKSKSRNVG